MSLCFITSFTAEGVVTINAMVMMTTDAWGPVRVDREAQLTVMQKRDISGVRWCLTAFWDIAMSG